VAVCCNSRKQLLYKVQQFENSHTKTTKHILIMSNKDKVYILGGAMWLISDLISDPSIMQTLRGGALESVAKRLKELMPELRLVSNTSLASSKIAEQSARYEKKLIQGIEKQIKADTSIADKQAEIQAVIDQFAMSSEYLHEWLRVLFVVPAENHAQLNEEIEAIIKKYSKP
jgi:PHP family Zn ribbon phosphoesterase